MRRRLLGLASWMLAMNVFNAAGFAQAANHFAPSEFQDWPQITDAERQMRSPLVQKDAGAEVLVWKAYVLDEFLSSSTLQRVYYNYVRLKVFDERGKEQAATIDLTSSETSSIIDVAGRTLKADGTFVLLDKNAIHQRDVVRVGSRIRKTTSFAMPGVEPGAIVEYRWKEVESGDEMEFVRLQLQREFPVQKVTYYLRPLSSEITSYQLRFQTFNCQPTFGKPDNQGYTPITVENIPAFRQESFAPSEPNLRAWVLAYYEPNNVNDPERYWNEFGKKAYQDLKNAIKADDDLKVATAMATAQAKTDQEKIVALAKYIRANLKNVSTDLTDAERVKFQDSVTKNRVRTASEIFKTRMGLPSELNVVFAAMAAHAGLDARLAYVADWNEAVFNPKTMMNRYYLDHVDMAVKLGGAWKVFDVSTKLLTPGMLPWRQEGVYALVSDGKAPLFIQTEASPAAASAESTKGSFSLSAQGELEGDAEETFTGHRAFDLRLSLAGESPERREEWLKDRVIQKFPDAEVSEIAIENADDPGQPLRFRYHLIAPGYAQVAGSRIFFHVLPFQRLQASPFSASERHNPVQFPYAWSESDNISITPPAGFVLDQPTSPGNIGFGSGGGYNIKIDVANNGQILVNREFTFGLIYFEVKDYPVVKQVFSEIQKRNTHTLALLRQQ